MNKVKGSESFLEMLLALIRKPTANPEAYRLAKLREARRLPQNIPMMAGEAAGIPGARPDDFTLSLISALGRGREIPRSPLGYSILDALEPDIKKRIAGRT